MKRLVFLAPTLEQAQNVVEDLRKMDIPDEKMHVVAKDHQMLQDANIHEATDMETSEVESDMDWGMVSGGTIGVIAGLAVLGTAPFGLVLGGGTLLTLSLLGIGFGGWLGKMIGEGTPNSLIEKYEHALDDGQIVMMVDVPAERLPEFHHMIRGHCPKALIESVHIFHDDPLAA